MLCYHLPIDLHKNINFGNNLFFLKGKILTSQAIHYPPIKITSQIVQHFVTKKDHPITSDKSKLMRWSFNACPNGFFLLKNIRFSNQKTMNCSRETFIWLHNGRSNHQCPLMKPISILQDVDASFKCVGGVFPWAQHTYLPMILLVQNSRNLGKQNGSWTKYFKTYGLQNGLGHEVVMGPTNKMFMVRCKVCTFVKKRNKLFVPKFDGLQTHVGWHKIIVARLNVKITWVQVTSMQKRNVNLQQCIQDVM